MHCAQESGGAAKPLRCLSSTAGSASVPDRCQTGLHLHKLALESGFVNFSRLWPVATGPALMMKHKTESRCCSWQFGREVDADSDPARATERNPTHVEVYKAVQDSITSGGSLRAAMFW